MYVNDKDDLPKSWQDIKDKWKEAVHPEAEIARNASGLALESVISQNGESSTPDK